MVDKPDGMTSHDVVDVVRDVAGQRKVGHTGTLDPSATGVLVLCLGRATRLVRFLQAGRKRYVAGITFGLTTTTQDADGDVLRERDTSALTREDVEAVLPAFRGEIEQVPPMVSAVRVGGERLHERARRGETVEREPRTVTVHELSLEEFEPGPRARARVVAVCSAGTYVRTLAHDLGEELGVGASLSSLRRTVNGAFTVAEAHPLEEVRKAGVADLVVPMRDALEGVLPTVVVDDPERIRQLTHGGWLPAQGIEGPYAVVAPDHLVGVYRDRETAGRPEAVLLRPEEV